MPKKIPVYSIDSGVPVPESNGTTRSQIPIHKLEVGESILFPIERRSAVAPLASRLKKDGKKFTIKKMDEKNIRIWRTQ